MGTIRDTYVWDCEYGCVGEFNKSCCAVICFIVYHSDNYRYTGHIMTQYARIWLFYFLRIVNLVYSGNQIHAILKNLILYYYRTVFVKSQGVVNNSWLINRPMFSLTIRRYRAMLSQLGVSGCISFENASYIMRAFLPTAIPPSHCNMSKLNIQFLYLELAEEIAFFVWQYICRY